MSETPRLYTRCPSCRNTTLTISDGGLLCTWHKCQNPTLIEKTGELIRLRERELAAAHAQIADLTARLAERISPTTNERKMCQHADKCDGAECTACAMLWRKKAEAAEAERDALRAALIDAISLPQDWKDCLCEQCRRRRERLRELGVWR